jgi:hypothetical protein
MPAVNHRISARQRRDKDIVRQKPPVARRPDVAWEARKLRIKGWLALLVLLPALVVSVFTLVELFFLANLEKHFWRTDEFVFFLAGGLGWWGAHWLGWRPVRLYVFSHEVTHLLVAKYLFRGKIFDWKVTSAGGYVETNKSNTWITLGPYMLPFYTLVVMALFGMAGLFWDLMQWRMAEIGPLVLKFRAVWALYFLVGFTWAFHLTYTLQTVHVEQGDLTRNGEFFSILLIVLVNLFLITLLFVAASPGISLAEIGARWWQMAGTLWKVIVSVFVWQ